MTIYKDDNGTIDFKMIIMLMRWHEKIIKMILMYFCVNCKIYFIVQYLETIKVAAQIVDIYTLRPSK